MKYWTDKNGIAWHVDKNGKPIQYGQQLLGDDGRRYELFGTGMFIPGDRALLVWTEDDKPVWRDPQTLRCVMSDGEVYRLGFLAVMVGVTAVAVALWAVGAMMPG